MNRTTDDGVVHERFFGDPERVAALALVRPLCHHLFSQLTLDDVVEMSAVDRTSLPVAQEGGFSYGETSIESVWRILSRIDLSVYECRGGATVIDLGCGIGNVVVDIALLAATDTLSGRIARVHGIELLPTLHNIAEDAISALLALSPPPLTLPLPACSVSCADIESISLADADLVYLTSTVFDGAFMRRFAQRAARELRVGSRVVTLGEPLQHPCLRVELRVPTCNSWGEEEAVVHLRVKPECDDAVERAASAPAAQAQEGASCGDKTADEDEDKDADDANEAEDAAHPLHDEAEDEDAADEEDMIVSLAAAHPAVLDRSVHGSREVTRIECAGLDATRLTSLLIECISERRPVILGGSVTHWPALRRWSDTYLTTALGTAAVHVARTPDGLADAITALPTGECVFAKPDEARMPFCEFVRQLGGARHEGHEGRADSANGRAGGSSNRCSIGGSSSSGSSGGRSSGGSSSGGSSSGGGPRRPVLYASHQNSSLSSEYEPLWKDVELSLAWADAAFGRQPSACNFWMGEDAARTTVHADLFDNLYVVVRGEKHFALLPPQEGHALRRQRVRAATYVATAGEAAAAFDLELRVDSPEVRVHWSDVDLESEMASELLRPLHAVVRPGELLVLPALWWHAVSQRATPGDLSEGGDGCCATVAINYWYEGPVALGDEIEIWRRDR